MAVVHITFETHDHHTKAAKTAFEVAEGLKAELEAAGHTVVSFEVTDKGGHVHHAPTAA